MWILSNTLDVLPPPEPVDVTLAFGITIVYESCSTSETTWPVEDSNWAVVIPFTAVVFLNLTLLPEVWNPWLGCVTLTYAFPLDTVLIVLNGWLGNNLLGSALLTKLISESAFVLNDALFNVNLRSLFCSGVHVEAFCDVNNTPLYGCFETLSLAFCKSNPPIVEIKAL